MVSSDVWDEETASVYDAEVAALFRPEVVEPAVDLLAALAGDGRALELAIGTGRIGIPLLRRGVPVTGIELSAAMAERLRTKVDADALPVVIGDMATTRVPGEFSLVYLVFNTITNLRSQAEQVACFRNAAAHLGPGGCFVVEVYVPPLRRLPPGQVAVPFDVSDAHTGFDTFDLVRQQSQSHHYTRMADGSTRYDVGSFRYVWPAELDLMAQLAGMELERRTEDWKGTPFTSDSETHISLWRKAT